MILDAHGLRIDLPDGWEGRIYRRTHGDPTLHAGNFALPPDDGDFGALATARMPPGAAFLVLTEYRPGQGLRPGVGLFAQQGVPLALHQRDFHPRALHVGRPAQTGLQRFFSASGRPFCLYAVRQAPRTKRHAVAAAHERRAVEGLNAVLASIAVAPAPGSAGSPKR